MFSLRNYYTNRFGIGFYCAMRESSCLLEAVFVSKSKRIQKQKNLRFLVFSGGEHEEKGVLDALEAR